MQHLKEFLTCIQTFDLRVIEDDIQIESGTNEKERVKTYDLTGNGKEASRGHCL